MVCNAIRKKNSAYTTTEQGEVVFCCEEMGEAWGEHFIGFGEFDKYPINRIEEVCIYHCSPYPEGAVFSEIPIKYCPFCSGPIKVVVTNAQD
jgi:hypothetical protein